MCDRMLVAIDASPDSPDDSLDRTLQFAKMPAPASACGPPERTSTSDSGRSSRAPSISSPARASRCTAN
jgi:hypothetical protein